MMWFKKYHEVSPKFCADCGAPMIPFVPRSKWDPITGEKIKQPPTDYIICENISKGYFGACPSKERG